MALPNFSIYQAGRLGPLGLLLGFNYSFTYYEHNDSQRVLFLGVVVTLLATLFLKKNKAAKKKENKKPGNQAAIRDLAWGSG